MIPQKLTIEGLYSYQQKQEIHFDQLLSAQLFGIFGQVGSGKSSILEAMMLAIYGETDRLNKSGDNRTYNLMNLRSNRLFIDFTCFSGESGADLYRFTFELKRNGKHFEKVNSPTRSILKNENGEWVNIGHLNAQAIVGMPLEHFRQTVIIPQGKFREFIELGPTARTQLMKELFGLHRFDLWDKANVLYKSANERLQQLNGQLEQLTDFTEERLSEIRAAHEQALRDSQKVADEVQQWEQQVQKLQALQADFEAQQQLLQRQQDLQAQESGMARRQQQLQAFSKAKLLEDKLLLVEQTARRLQDKQQQQAALKAREMALKHDLEQTQQVFEQQKTAFEKLDEERQKLRELQLILQIVQENQAQQALQQAAEQAEREAAQLSKAAEEAKMQRQELRKEQQQLHSQEKDIAQLKEWESWWKKEADLTSAQQKTAQEQQAVGKALQQISEQLDRLAQPLSLPNNWEAFPEALQAQQTKVQQQLDRLEGQWQHLSVQQKVAQMAHSLTEGQPCPLCGSMEHPHPSQPEEHDQKLRQLEQQQKALKLQKQQLEAALQAFAKLSVQKDSEEKALSKASAATEEAAQQLQAHRNNRPEGEVFASLEAVQQVIAVQNQLKKQLKSLQKRQEEQEATSEQLLEKQQQAQKKHQEAAAKLQASQTKTATMTAQVELMKPKLPKYLAYSAEKIQESCQRGKEKIADTEAAYQQAAEKREKLHGEMQQLAGTLAETAAALQDLQAQQTDAQKAFAEKLAESAFGSAEAVAEMLRLALDVDAEEKALKAYEEQCSLVKAQLAAVSEKLKEQPFDAAALENATEKLHKSKQQLEAYHKKQGQLKGQMEEAALKLETKVLLLDKQTQTAKRLDNLKVMKNLFKSAGFVDFVAKIYLENLVKSANKRFERLNRNALSLYLDESGNFAVTDNLNGGKTRLLKTLSGGQTFQACLCLALTLAENVRAINQSEKSFFFIDEGFGSLDKSALQAVFESLRQLQKENRIVGVISHVEELQQEIPVSLRIVADPEKGSLVKPSWES